ncbi:hypothetical protein CLOSBL3_11688 [Clostridiaceae bacterium BL-3]|nr:hypothetical protein CLOSBL3_11688 [Clostridiaceae bacterium BL-3]
MIIFTIGYNKCTNYMKFNLLLNCMRSIAYETFLNKKSF